MATPPAATPKRPNILLVITDDQSWCHTTAAGDPVVRTPHFDRVAREGVLFTNAYCSAPSCAPSRAAILTGRDFNTLAEAANLLSPFPARFPVYNEELERSGYAVGYAGKCWGPGVYEAGGRTREPGGPNLGPAYRPDLFALAPSLRQFVANLPSDQPFAFWFGTLDPHRPYEAGHARLAGIDADRIVPPSFLPNVPEVRADLAEYYAEIERADRDLGVALDALAQLGRLDDTIVVVTSDNGMPFPRGKCSLYDHGTRMPLAIRWPRCVHPGRTVTDFVSLTDLAPTFLAAAGVPLLPGMTGRSLLPLLTASAGGRIDPTRDRVFLGRERHNDTRRIGSLSVGYPMRAVRTADFLFIRNFHPERTIVEDCDDGPTLRYLVSHRLDDAVAPVWNLCLGARPAEELYDLSVDPDQVRNVASDPRYTAALHRLRNDLQEWMRQNQDPRASDGGDVFDRYPIVSRRYLKHNKMGLAPPPEEPAKVR